MRIGAICRPITPVIQTVFLTEYRELPGFVFGLPAGQLPQLFCYRNE